MRRAINDPLPINQNMDGGGGGGVNDCNTDNYFHRAFPMMKHRAIPNMP